MDTGKKIRDLLSHQFSGNIQQFHIATLGCTQVPFLKGLIFPDGVAGTQLEAESDQDGQRKDQSKEKRSAKSVQSKGVLKSLSDHEAVTSHLVLFKYLW